MVSSGVFRLGSLPYGVGMNKRIQRAKIEKICNEKTHMSKN